MTSIVIPDSVTSIGDGAFPGCSGLTSITIPDSVTSIGEYAFFRCSGLTSVTIPDSVVSIGKDAFYGCSGLTSITIPFVGEKMDGTGETSFDHIFGIGVPDSLKEVVITGGASIGDWAFSDCDGLTSVTIGNGVTSIGEYAFSGCCDLTSVTIPDSVVSIGVGAFSGCEGLTRVDLPDSVTSLGWCAFYECSGLTSITIPFVGEKMDGTGNTCFNHIFGIDVPDSLKEIVITGGASIGDWAFSDCDGLTSVTIGNSVTSIGSSAFLGCSGLTSIAIPNSVTSLGWCAFYECSGLTDITYHGTMAQWRAIKKGYGWDKGTPGYKVHCTDGVLGKDDD